jgi:NitT/TauT family transport system permease protein
VKNVFPPLIALALLLIFLELGVSFSFINPALLPAPSSILQTMWMMKRDFWSAFSDTALHTLAAYISAAVIGSVLAFLFSLFSWARRAVLPFAIFFQTVPIIAIAPLLVIYFGFGASTVVISAVIVALFPILANTLIGLDSVGLGELEMFKLMGANRWQILRMLRIPSAYVSIYSGLKVSAGLSVIGTVAGEFVAGGGLGGLIDAARTQQRIDIVFGALVLLSVLGLILIGGVKSLHWMMNRWRPFAIQLKEI